MPFKILTRSLLFKLCLLLYTVAVQAQLPVADVFKQAYQKGTRDTSGKPGVNYWQNRADYELKVDFNPVTRLIKGTVEIKYTNHSPDTLKEIWFKLYPNLYQRGNAKNGKVKDADLGDGVQLTQVLLNNKVKELASMIVEGTNMHTSIAPLLPGKSLTFQIDYYYTLNKGSHLRTGEVAEGAHFIAYFFPRIAVYDDIDGWNKIPYNGEEEFYNDYGNFKAAIKVPENYTVWATGDLTNASSVFSKEVFKKYQLANTQDDVIDVIALEDLKQGNVSLQNPFHTFKFEATNVIDFAFATSNHYLWKSTSLIVDSLTKRRTRVDAVFNPKHKDYYEVIDFAKQTVHAMSYVFPKWPYPYSHETVFDGLDQMEYPMMVNDNPVNSREDAITLTTHEIFHTLFPFYVGTNETKYAWMDEGWATMGEWLISAIIDDQYVDEYGIAETGNSSGSKNDSPIVTETTALKGIGSFTNSYPKPGLGYLFVKDYLGDELFIKALHHYLTLWNGKHPMPHDFFNSMNAGAGKNLDWFWKRWFFDDGVTDMAIKDVRVVNGKVEVEVLNKSNKPMPIDLNLTYADGSTQKVHHTIAVWEQGNTTYLSIIETEKRVKKVVLGSSHVPDKNRNDNTFVLK